MALKAGRVGVNPKEVDRHGYIKDKGGGGEQYVLPVADSTTLGGVQPVSKTNNMTKDVGVDSNGKLYTAPYTLSKATATSLGGVRAVPKTEAMTREVGIDSDGKLYVEPTGGGAVVDTLMQQGQVSNTSSYMTATFDVSVDVTIYDYLLFELYRGGVMVGIDTIIKPENYPVAFTIDGGNYEYQMSLTTTSISCTRYSGSYVNLYVDVIGIKE